MRKFAIFLCGLILWAGYVLPFSTPARAATIISPRYPVSVTLNSHGVQAVNGKYFFKSGQQITLSVGFDDMSSTCISETNITAEIVRNSANYVLFNLTQVPGQDSHYSPVFHHTVAANAASGKIELYNGPNWCGTGDDYMWSPYGETLYDDGTKILNNQYFLNLFTTEMYIDNTPPSITFGKASDITYKKNHGVTVTATDAPVNANITLFSTWTQSATPPAAASISTPMLNGAPALDPGGSGSYYLHVKAIDVVGSTTIRTAGPFNYDNQQPDVTITPMYGVASTSHSVQYASSDEHSGVQSTSYEWSKDGVYYSGGSGNSGTLQVPNSLDGSYKLKVIATDVAANVRTSESLAYIIDRTPPSVTFSTQGNGTSAQSRQVDVTLVDARATLGQAYYQWSSNVTQPAANDPGWQLFFDGSGSKTTHSAALTSPAEANGSLYLHVKTTDSAGNVGFANTSQGFSLDNTKPTASFDNTGNLTYSQSTATKLSVSDNDNPTATNFTIKYSITEQATTDGDDASWNTSGDGQFTLDNRTGTYYIHAKVYDEAGNWTLVRGGPYYLDNTAPTGSLQIVKTITNQNTLPVTLSASDLHGSIEMRLLVDGVQVGGWVGFLPTAQVALPSVDGQHNIGVQYRDQVGNISPVYEQTVIYDATAPIATQIVYSTQASTNQPVTATVTVTDNLTAAGDIVVDNPTGLTYVFQSNGTFTYKFRDQAGNENTAVATVTWIDKTEPEVSFSVNGTSSSSQSVSSVISATDNGPGPLQYAYAWSQDAISEPIAWNGLAPDATARLNGVDGDWYLWAKVTDPAGNVKTMKSGRFLLDNTAPIGTVAYNPSGRTAGTVTATLSANEGITITNPSSGVATHDFTDNGSFEFVFRDTAGNVGTVTASVYQIDRSTPSANVTFSTTAWTNGTVRVTVDADGSPPRAIINMVAPADAALVSQTVSKVVYDFHSNGSLHYTIIDLDTGKSSDPMSLTVSNIDKIAPIGTLSYSHGAGVDTNEDVTVTLTIKDDRLGAVNTILNNNGSDRYTFTQNGTFTFLFRDNAGNMSEATATVTNIDKEKPQAVATYSETAWTRNDVTVSVTFPNETKPVTITNNNGSAQYTFSTNGSFVLEYRDAAGNVGNTTLKVNHIDREAPTGTIVYSQAGWTNQNVTATLVALDNSGEAPQVINNGGSTSYSFTLNGTFTFTFRDEAGNESTATAMVDRIDKTPPTVELQYSTLTETRADVRAVLVANEPVTVIGNNGSTAYDFRANGSYTFQVVDRAGNQASVTASVYNIDRTPPVLAISYSSTTTTKEDVIVTVSASEPFVVLNNNRSKQVVFKENGRFIFMVQDMAGNTAEIEAVVNHIDKAKAKVTYQYSDTAPTMNNVTVTIDSDRSLTVEGVTGNTLTFTENGTRWLVATDSLNNRYDLRVEVKNIDRQKPMIRFKGGEQLLIQQGTIVDPKADVEAIDNLDGNVLTNVSVTHNIAPQVPGEYTLTYSVTDRAGNISTVTRKATVIAPTSFMLYVNSKLMQDEETLAYGDAIQLRSFGNQGMNQVKWLRGYKNKGDFKSTRDLVQNGVLPISEYGYYTFYLQDQERQSKLIRVYILPLPDAIQPGGTSSQ